MTMPPATRTTRSTSTRLALTSAVLRLRMQVRAAGYNPDVPYEVSALACVLGVDTCRLADVLAGRARLGWLVPRGELAEVLGVEAVAGLDYRLPADVAALDAERGGQR